jgi:transposase
VPQALLTLSQDHPQGHPPVPPAPLALATLLPAYPQVSEDEVIAATTMERRWPLVLDCLDCETPPFSTGTLVALRQRVLAPQMDRRLRERTVERAARRGGCGARPVRAALDSSPWWGRWACGRDR